MKSYRDLTLMIAEIRVIIRVIRVLIIMGCLVISGVLLAGRSKRKKNVGFFVFLIFNIQTTATITSRRHVCESVRLHGEGKNNENINEFLGFNWKAKWGTR